MTKMNRRDYLTLMGVGAGLTLGASCKKALEQRATPPAKTEQTTSTRSEKPLTWKERWSDPFPKYPPEQTIKLIFYGLASLSPGKEGNKANCEVGFHSSGDQTHRHQLSIYAFDNVQPAGCTTRYDSTNPREQIAKIELRVAQPHDNVQEALFFQPGDVQRRKELSDDRDFRWIIDFESDYLYRNFPGSAHPEKLPKVPFIYRPTFTVPSGLFYTLRKTASTFQVKTTDGASVIELGNVADVLGANIYVKPGTGVSLFVNTREHRVQAPGEIYFINTCTKDTAGNHCDADPSSPDKKKRNDFYLHYKGFELEGKPEYELFLLQGHQQSTRADVVCAPDKLEPHISLTDEAPCAAAGYGGGH